MWSPQFATADIFKGDNLSRTHYQLKSNPDTVKKNLHNDIKNDFPLKYKAAAAYNTVFTETCYRGYDHAIALIDALEPLFDTINHGGLTNKEAWRHVMLYIKTVFDAIHCVRLSTMNKPLLL